MRSSASPLKRMITAIGSAIRIVLSVGHSRLSRGDVRVWRPPLVLLVSLMIKVRSRSPAAVKGREAGLKRLYGRRVDLVG